MRTVFIRVAVSYGNATVTGALRSDVSKQLFGFYIFHELYL